MHQYPKKPSSQQPPKLPMPLSNDLTQGIATRHQRIRAGLIDHFVDSTVWLWLFLMAIWTALHLQISIDARTFLMMICSNFSVSMSVIALLLIADFLLCIYRGQSLGQMLNGIYKVALTSSNPLKNHALNGLTCWLHGLISRCLGLPLLLITLFFWLNINPTISPIHLQYFSLIEPEGSYLLMIFLLKIIGFTFVLFALFLPAGLAFIRGELPTWYDRLLSISILKKSPDSQH